MEINNVFVWTDSTIVLSWLASEPRTWKTFISNHTAEIRQLTSVHDWNHVPSKHNPADIVSQGVGFNDLINPKVWWHGLSFLLQSLDKWPSNANISNFSRKSSTLPEYKEPRV